MDVTADELAGVADLFGALTRAELAEGLAELAFKRGEEYEPTSFEDAIEAAVRTYHLVAVADGETRLLVPGPVAFPALPDGAEDLPHILDVDERQVDRERAAAAAMDRFEDDVAEARAADDKARIAELLDVSYELEAWAGVDLSETRSTLSA